jgi:hypothetical protein
MRENPIGNALAFLVATDKLWFTVIFWLLLLGSAAAAALTWRADPAQRSLRQIGYGLIASSSASCGGSNRCGRYRHTGIGA